MNRYLVFLSLLILLLIGGMGAGALQQDRSEAVSNNKSASSSNSPAKPVTGEEVFQANCGRCHRPPMTISQRTTGTIVMHMRVRARLSRQDEQLLLKYMAP
jgi:hypothetical protein